MRSALAVLALVATLSFSGCDLDPFDPETVPALEEFEVRVTRGIGAADPFFQAVEVGPDSTVQFAMLVGDGRAVEVTIPREPATQIDAEARLEGSDTVVARATLTSLDGEPISVAGLFSFDPGYVSVETRTLDDELRIRIATPRLTGTPQGQVPFTFKTNVLAG